jgi:hypothetical protein
MLHLRVVFLNTLSSPNLWIFRNAWADTSKKETLVSNKDTFSPRLCFHARMSAYSVWGWQPCFISSKYLSTQSSPNIRHIMYFQQYIKDGSAEQKCKIKTYILRACSKILVLVLIVCNGTSRASYRGSVRARSHSPNTRHITHSNVYIKNTRQCILSLRACSIILELVFIVCESTSHASSRGSVGARSYRRIYDIY